MHSTTSILRRWDQLLHPSTTKAPQSKQAKCNGPVHAWRGQITEVHNACMLLQQAMGGFRQVATMLGLKYKNNNKSKRSSSPTPNDKDAEHAALCDSSRAVPVEQPQSCPVLRQVPGTPLFWRNGQLLAASEEGLSTFQVSGQPAACKPSNLLRLSRQPELAK